MNLLVPAVLALVVGGLVARFLIVRLLRVARDQHHRRPALWNRFYAVDWGETSTNNYGFAPADESHPQRFQREMYRQLLARFDATGKASDTPLKLLEVSCGRGGGLMAFLEASGERFDATGLDVAAPAIDFCRRVHGEHDRQHFVQGSALALPFPDASFDVVLNVEASNDYGDREGFFAEVSRVLKDDGVFLYADTCRDLKQARRAVELRDAGFDARLDDITANVVDACREDSPRRREVIRRHSPLFAKMAFLPQLDNYAAVEGSRKFNAFASGERRYLMTAATRLN